MLWDLFIKDIYREIHGVIQAGQLDEARIAQELDEYVVTEELAGHLKDLLGHYVRSLHTPTDEIGVWISGFFGSGKSHFLKIVSYLLGQRAANGKTAIEYFREKHLDPELIGLIEEAGRRRADTLLFNIEAKSAVGNRSQRKNIVEVFLRVFNSHLGYSDTLWIAEIEHTLAREGKLAAFCDAVRRILGREWPDVRDTLALRQAPFVQALQDTGYDEASAASFLRIMEQNFEVTPEQFAKRIAEYCRARGKEHRLIFLVDEIGQYVGDSSDLMLNLQTVVEELGTHGRGQVWVMVTSQESIDTVTNVRGREYDFSKIQGRFGTRINLSSTNTDDVIKWRILQKKETATASLRALYDQKEQSLRNMLSFDTSTHALKAGYRSSEEFAEAYPFQPYQFELLQKVFEKVRKQGEAGKSLSHGERSLLNAFQEALQVLDRAGVDGALAPFSLFYDTIETFLDSPVKSTVRRAAKRSDLNPLDIQVLKVLYLIKNIPEVPATVTNVATLLIDRLDAVRRDLETAVRASLDKLVLYHLVAQNADGTYTFLSDEEQEINREISAIRIDPVQVAEKLGRIFFEDICPRKYRADHGRDFDFNKRFDPYAHGVQREPLTLLVMTGVTPSAAQMQSLEPGVLVMLLPEAQTEYREAMERSLQIEQYTRRDVRGLSDSQRRILQHKQQFEVVEFEKKARSLFREACKQSTFYILGQEEKYSGEPEQQINRALAKLVANTYTYLDYIDSPISMSHEVREITDRARQGLPGSTVDERRNGLALDAVLRYLEERDRQHVPTTVDDLVIHFSAPPYGWMDRDIAGLVAVLLHDGNVKLTHMGEPLTPAESNFAERLLRATERKKVVVRLLREVPPEVQTKVRRLLSDHFGDTPDACDSYDALAHFIREQIMSEMGEPLRLVVEQQKDPPRAGEVSFPYPDEALAKRLQTEVNGLLAPDDPETFVQGFLAAEPELDAWLEQIRRLYNFFTKSPKKLFDQAVEFLHEHRSDWDFAMDRPDIMTKKNQLEAILRDEQPYSRIPELPRLTEELKHALDAVLEEQRQGYRPRFEAQLAEVEELARLYANRAQIQALIEAAKEKIRDYEHKLFTESKLASLAGYAELAQRAVEALRGQIDRILREGHGPAGDIVKDGGPEDGGHPGGRRTRPERKISLGELSQRLLPNGELRLEGPEQVQAYMELLKRELNQMVKDFVIVIRR